MNKSKFSKYKEIFFDCDGTIIDSEIHVQKASIKVLHKALNDHPEINITDQELEDIVHKYAGYGFDDMLQAIEKHFDIFLDVNALRKDRSKKCIKALKNVAHTPNIKETFNQLAANKIDFSVVSSSGLKHIKKCLEATGLKIYFPKEKRFSAKHSLPKPALKPLPDVYLKALDDRQRTADEVLAVEDSVAGTLAAVAAGIKTIGYTGGAHITEERKAAHTQDLLNAGASLVIDDMAGLPAAIKAIEHASSPDAPRHTL